MANRQINIENLTMNEVLKSMHRLGGQVTRKEIRQDIHDNSNVISEDEVDKIKVSKKTGNKYSPFAWTLNYAVKYLIMTGYLIQDGRLLELSEKGRNVELSSFDGARDVRPIVEKMLTKQKQKSYIEPLVQEWLDAYRGLRKDPDDMTEILILCSKNIALFNMVFKNPRLFHEEEFRFVSLRKNDGTVSPELKINGVPYINCEFVPKYIQWLLYHQYAM